MAKAGATAQEMKVVNRLTFTGVRVYAPYEAPESAASLIGRSIAECFKLVVVDDWVGQELEEAVFKCFRCSLTFHRTVATGRLHGAMHAVAIR